MDMNIEYEDAAFNQSATPEGIAKCVKEALSKLTIEEIEQLLREIEACLAAHPSGPEDGDEEIP
jgi:hypothetical protein